MIKKQDTNYHEKLNEKSYTNQKQNAPHTSIQIYTKRDFMFFFRKENF